MCASSSCNQIPQFSANPNTGGAGRGAWTVARNPQSATQAGQPILVVPSAENPAEQGVFVEIKRLRESNQELQLTVDRAVAESEQNRATIAERTAELSASRAELATLQRQVQRLSSDVQDWRRDVLVMHEQLYERQRDELATLDGLIISVEAIVDAITTPHQSPSVFELVPASTVPEPPAAQTSLLRDVN